MSAAIIILIYLFVGFFEITGLKKNKKKREIIVFSILFSAAFILSILLSFDIKLLSLERIVGDSVMPLIGDAYE